MARGRRAVKRETVVAPTAAAPEAAAAPGADATSTNQEECSVCLDPLKEKRTTRLDCSHEFHRTCVLEWLEKRDSQAEQSCPNCREEVEQLISSTGTMNIGRVPALGVTRLPTKAGVMRDSLQKKQAMKDYIQYLIRRTSNCIFEVAEERVKASEAEKEAARTGAPAPYPAEYVPDCDAELRILDKRRMIYREMENLYEEGGMRIVGNRVPKVEPWNLRTELFAHHFAEYNKIWRQYDEQKGKLDAIRANLDATYEEIVNVREYNKDPQTPAAVEAEEAALAYMVERHGRARTDERMEEEEEREQNRRATGDHGELMQHPGNDRAVRMLLGANNFHHARDAGASQEAAIDAANAALARYAAFAADRDRPAPAAAARQPASAVATAARAARAAAAAVATAAPPAAVARQARATNPAPAADAAPRGRGRPPTAPTAQVAPAPASASRAASRPAAASRAAAAPAVAAPAAAADVAGPSSSSAAAAAAAPKATRRKAAATPAAATNEDAAGPSTSAAAAAAPAAARRRAAGSAAPAAQPKRRRQN